MPPGLFLSRKEIAVFDSLRTEDDRRDERKMMEIPKRLEICATVI